MLRILRKNTASSAKISRSTTPDQCDAVVDELSTWELVNPSLTDDEDLSSFDGDDVIGDEPESEADEEEEEKKGGARESCEFATCSKPAWVSPPTTFPVDLTRHHARCDEEEEEEKDDDDEDDVCDDDDGVDDDLVPWELKGRFGKQRIMKMGKQRCVPKTNRSSKLPCYYHNKPKSFYEKSHIGTATTLVR